MAVNLTPGAITILLSGRYTPRDLKLVLPCNISLHFRPDRYGVWISDGSFHQSVLLSSQLSELVRSQQFQSGPIVRLTYFNCSMIRVCPFIVIQDLDVILSECDIIGAPTPYHGNENPATEILISYPEESDVDSDSNEDVDDSHHPQEALSSK